MISKISSNSMFQWVQRVCVRKHLFIYFLATPTSFRSLWARDRTHATVVPRATAVTMPDL